MSSTRVEAEFNELQATNSWYSLFQKITSKCQIYHSLTCDEAKKTYNKPWNRYRDVHPYDHSRVLLGSASKDYINANLVKVEKANRRYILTQGPLVITVPDFWLMVWEQNTRGIVMLNNIFEIKEEKCHCYWPSGVGPENAISMGCLLIEQIDEDDYKFFRVRTFRVTNKTTDETRAVLHFHYTTWPDFGVPSSAAVFLEFLMIVREAGVLENDVGPAVIHCSAGIGRSGTFCLVDSAFLLIEREGQENVNVQEIVVEMRKYRMGLVQTAEQLRFSYKAIVEGIKSLKPDYDPSSSSECLHEEEAGEETPPPPPPRGNSLGRPLHPLPPAPLSASAEDLSERYSGPQSQSQTPENVEQSSEDLSIRPIVESMEKGKPDNEGRGVSREEMPPPPPPRGINPPPAEPATHSVEAPGFRVTEPPVQALVNGVLNTGDESSCNVISPSTGEEFLRYSRSKEALSEKIKTMKKRSQEADRAQALDRSSYNPLTVSAISVGVIVAVIVSITIAFMRRTPDVP